MSTPLQRAEELKSLISQYQAELSDIYSEIHSSNDDNFQIIAIPTTYTIAYDYFKNIVLEKHPETASNIYYDLYRMTQLSQENQKMWNWGNTYGGSYEGYLRGWITLKYNNYDPSYNTNRKISIVCSGDWPVFCFQPVMFI